MKNAALLSLVFAAVIAPTTLFATTFSGYVVANPNGTVVRGTGYSVFYVDTGRYEISTTFPNDIHSCAYSITAGSGDTTVPSPAIATVVGRRETHEVLEVATFDLNGSYADSGFHLIVQCAGGNILGGAAMVDPDGTLVRGASASSAIRTGTGAYNVTFSSQNLSTTCAYTASIGQSATSGIAPPGFVTVAAVSAGTIAVRTYDTKGNAADSGFQVYAACQL